MRYIVTPPGGYDVAPMVPVMVVGCGGTGGYVAEGLCRLLDKGADIWLVDHDRVEERNMVRQNFYPSEIGRFKSEVLAERLAIQYGRNIGYTTLPVEMLPIEYRGAVTIGCVDNPAARERLQLAGRYMMGPHFSYNKRDSWYIDAGNSEYSGQVLIGNSFGRNCSKGFRPQIGICNTLPLPQVQQPGLLAPETTPPPNENCAERVIREEQSPLINRVMADLVLTFVHKLLNGKLTWMGAYIDLENGTLSTIDATPENVSRITGHSVSQLEYRPRRK